MNTPQTPEVDGSDAEGTISLVLADDHEMIREGVKALLLPVKNIRVVGEAATGQEAVAAALAAQPDVVLMDIHMPILDGIEATRQIVSTSPHIRVLILTMMDDDDSVFAAIRAGALGYLLKGAGRAELVRAVQAASQGEAIYSPAIAQRIIAYFANPQPRQLKGRIPELTEREREVLDLISAGHNNATIARRLFVSPKTVRNHISNIFSKLHLADRSQAIVYGRQQGLGGATADSGA